MPPLHVPKENFYPTKNVEKKYVMKILAKVG